MLVVGVGVAVEDWLVEEAGLGVGAAPGTLGLVQEREWWPL